MKEQSEFKTQLNEHIQGLKSQSEKLRSDFANFDLQIKYYLKQMDLFEKYGAKLPIAMQTAQFILEQIAAASKVSSLEVTSTTSGDSSLITPIETENEYSLQSEKNKMEPVKNYNIGGPAKPIMCGIFGRSREDVPTDLETLFKGMYGQNWHLRTIDVPLGPSLPSEKRTYSEDLKLENSYIRRLIEKADDVINRKMRGNIPPNYPFGGKVAAFDLVQLFNKINAVGWDVYDNFMVRNNIRHQ
ncbi:MAG: hypothetical protein V1808_00375 [Candidatus Daviesbacteria bacterium]